MSVRFYEPSMGILRRPYGYPTTSARIYDHFLAKMKIARCPHDHRAVPIRGSYDVTAMCLRATGLRFFQICHCAELNKIVEAMMPVNPYDVRKVTLWRSHGTVIWTSY